MSERASATEFSLIIPPVPKDKVEEQFAWFWIALAAAGKEEAVDLVSEPMEQSSPKLQEFIKRITRTIPINDALDFELGAHFVFNILCFFPLPNLRVITIRRFESELKRWQEQLGSLIEMEPESEPKLMLKAAKDKLTTDFVLPTPKEFRKENEFLMGFLATRSPGFAVGGSAVYELYKRELVSRKVDKLKSTFRN